MRLRSPEFSRAVKLNRGLSATTVAQTPLCKQDTAVPLMVLYRVVHSTCCLWALALHLRVKFWPKHHLRGEYIFVFLRETIETSG